MLGEVGLTQQQWQTPAVAWACAIFIICDQTAGIPAVMIHVAWLVIRVLVTVIDSSRRLRLDGTDGGKVRILTIYGINGLDFPL